MRRPRTLLATLAVAVLASGCGQDTVKTTASEPSPTGDVTAPGELLLQVEQTGGFRPVGADFAAVPELTVLADGRAFALGPQPAIFPGPLLPNVRVHQLAAEQLAELRALARDAGLLAAPPDYGQTLVTDATTTVVRLVVDGRSYEHQVYALGFDVGPPGEATEPVAPSSADAAPPSGAPGELLPLPRLRSGLTAEAQQARDRISAFLDAARTLVPSAGPGQAYVPASLAVRSAPAVDEGPGGPVEPTVRPWPLEGVALGGAGDCTVVAGTDAATVLPVLQEATAITRFEQSGTRYTVTARPLLPGEQGC